MDSVGGKSLSWAALDACCSQVRRWFVGGQRRRRNTSSSAASRLSGAYLFLESGSRVGGTVVTSVGRSVRTGIARMGDRNAWPLTPPWPLIPHFADCGLICARRRAHRAHDRLPRSHRCQLSPLSHEIASLFQIVTTIMRRIITCASIVRLSVLSYYRDRCADGQAVLRASCISGDGCQDTYEAPKPEPASGCVAASGRVWRLKRGDDSKKCGTISRSIRQIAF